MKSLLISNMLCNIVELGVVAEIPLCSISANANHIYGYFSFSMYMLIDFNVVQTKWNFSVDHF